MSSLVPPHIQRLAPYIPGTPIDQIGPTSTDYLAFMNGLFKEMVWFLSDEFGGDIDDVSVEVDTRLNKGESAILFRDN